MTHRDPSEPSRLLEDLESIRTLLDEHDPDNLLDEQSQMDIPLLQDIITEPIDTKLADSRPARPEASPAATESSNPFLPYDSLARLAREPVQLDRLLGTPVTDERDSAHTGAREVRLEARLQAEAQLILQDLIDDMIPTIEAELRNRLKAKLEQIVREQLK